MRVSVLSGTLPLSRVTRGIGWVWVTALLCSAAAFAIRVYALSSGESALQAGSNDAVWQIILWLVLFPGAAFMYASVGALIAVRHPTHAIGRLCLLAGFLIPLEDILWQSAALVYQASPLMVAPGWLALLSQGIQALWLPLAVTLILLLFPTGRLIDRRWRWVMWVAGTGALLSAVASIMRPYYWAANELRIMSPLYNGMVGEWDRADQFATVLVNIAQLISLVSLCLALASLIVRWIRADQTERQQLKWLLFAVALGLILVIGSLFTNVWFLYILGLGFILFGTPAAMAFAVLRYRLLDIDFIINRALLYAALTAFVIVVYALIVGAIGALLGTQDNLLLALLSTGFVAVAFQPARERLQRAVNRLVYGQRREPFAVVTQLGQQLEANLAGNDMLRAVAQTIGQGMKLPVVEIATSANGAVMRWSAGATRNTPSLEVFPLAYQEELLGELRVAPLPGERLEAADRVLMENLARQAAIAVHAANVTSDLQRSRERIVSAREEERRRLRRDLHDGIGPTLASLYQRIDAASTLAARDPAEAAQLLNDTKVQMKDAIASLRQMVYELRPPALDEFGLVAAVREQCDRLLGRRNAPQLEMLTPAALPPLPAAVEAAAYRIAVEAVSNVLQHARATHCAIRISLVGGLRTSNLVVEVSDDGIGMPEPLRSGVGLQSMRERAEELGGCVLIEAGTPRGTHLRALLPLASEEMG